MQIPDHLENLLTSEENLEGRLTAIMQALCEVLSCDRCFLDMRHPETTLTRISHSYCTRTDHESLVEPDWVYEYESILNDPLMILALNSPDAVYVEDVELANADTIDLAYEQEMYKSRALVHAPIYAEGQLFGILEPCMFDEPRVWTEADRWLIGQMQQRLAPLVLQFLDEDLQRALI